MKSKIKDLIALIFTSIILLLAIAILISPELAQSFAILILISAIVGLLDSISKRR